ncbi:MAG: HD domain-containing protein [Firmicutes bacterium]|nr:HD domain-containing protein [Bacillota bacterium]
MSVTYDMVKHNAEINAYIRGADASMSAMGYTEHSFAHVGKCADMASRLLLELGYSEREAELARIAAHMHDIGNLVNRNDHAHSGAVMAFTLLDKLGMAADEIALVVSAIGHHDEHTAVPVNPIAAALILADKSDVRRSRVRNRNDISFDIHDRVNYAVEHADLVLDKPAGTITLNIGIDTEICAVMDYFEIFTTRMLLCRRAAEFFGLHFKLLINGAVII